MKKNTKHFTKLVACAMLCLGLGACGSGTIVGGDTQSPQPQPTNLYVKTGTIATDSWGYTGAAPTPIQTPAQAEIILKERTLLQTASRVVVAGTSATRVEYSPEVANLPASARASAPANMVCYLKTTVGAAATALPVPIATVDVGAQPAGQALTIYSYDSGSNTWSAVQTAAVDNNGKITMQMTHFGLWGIFR